MAAAYRILSIDGGGIRGVIPATVLARLEEVCGRPTALLFDLIVGTSTGGILALGLTTAGADGRTPARTAREFLRLYVQEGGGIFPGGGPRSLRDRLFGRPEEWRNPVRTMKQVAQRVGSVTGGSQRFAGGARYFVEGLEAALDAYVGDAEIKAALTDVVVTSYDLANNEPVLFSNRAWPGCTTDAKVRTAARATSAAPTYFEPEPFVSDGKQRALVDGGVYLGSPALLAYVLGSAAAAGKSILLVSLGTGASNPRQPLSPGQVKTASWPNVARMVLEAGMSGGGQLADAMLHRLLGVGRYWRLQTTVGACDSAMDNASAENIACLQGRAADLVADSSAAFAELRQELLRAG